MLRLPAAGIHLAFRGAKLKPPLSSLGEYEESRWEINCP